MIMSGIRFYAEGEGQGKFEIPDLPSDISLERRPTNINMVIVEERADGPIIRDWPVKDGYGFNYCPVANYSRRGRSVSFNVGPDVVNPLAKAGVNTCILKIRDDKGSIFDFTIDLKSQPIASDIVIGQTVVDAKSSFTQVQDANFAANNKAAGLGAVSYPNAAQFDNQVAAAPEPPVAQAAPAAQAAFAPNNQGASAGAGVLGMAIKVIAALAVLGIIAGIVMYVLGMFKGSAPSAPEPVDPVKQACSLQEKLDDKTVLNACLAAKPSDEHLFALMADAMQNDRCEIVLRVLRTKGRADNGGAYAYTYAQYADPQSSYQSKCIEKNASDVTYWTERMQADKNFNQQEADKLIKLLP